MEALFETQKENDKDVVGTDIDDEVELEGTPFNFREFPFMWIAIDKENNNQEFFVIDELEALIYFDAPTYGDLYPILDEIFGEYNWGSTHSFDRCSNCSSLIRFTSGSHSHYQGENGFICYTCANENPDEYIDMLTSNRTGPFLNYILEDETLIRKGFSKIKENIFGWNALFSEVKKKRQEHPQWRILASSDGHSESIWARDPNNKTKITEDKEGNTRFIKKFGEETYNRFLSLKQRMPSPEKDISYWMKREPQELVSFLDNLENTPTLKQKNIKAKKGARLLLSNPTWNVYEISTLEASAKYGKGTKWCISGKDCEAPSAWKRFTEQLPNFPKDDSVFLFFINKIYSDRYAVLYNNKTREYLIWNELDNPTAFILEAPELTGFPDFSVPPLQLKKDIAKGLNIKEKDIVGITNSYEIIYEGDHLEKYNVEYRKSNGKIVDVDVYRSPETDHFEIIKYMD